MAPMAEEAAAAAYPQMTKIPSPSPHFILVHGIGGGGWCWYKIRSLLQSSGHRVSCVDLKSAGIDPTDPNSVLSFEDYNEPLIKFLSSLPENDKIILVGHSAGGLSVTHATHKFGKKIHLAVYVAATMLRLGYATEQDAIDGVPDFTDIEEDVYDLGFGFGSYEPPTSAIIRDKYQRRLLYQMSPIEDSILASMLLKPGPIRALQSATFTEEQDVDQVRRVYIGATHDRIIKPCQQDAMIKKWPLADVFVLESDHSPFFSASTELFGLLVKVASFVECQ